MERRVVLGILGLTLIASIALTIYLTGNGTDPDPVAVEGKEGEGARHRVVIVGAGVAGLTAAAALLERNVTDIVVLEAEDRLGGRIHTVQFGGVIMDLGAEFCLGEQGNPVYELASSMLTSYLPFINPEGYVYANTSGYVFNKTQINKLVDTLYSTYKEKGMEDEEGSVADFLLPRVDSKLSELQVDGYLREALRHLVALMEVLDSDAESLADLGARGFKAYWPLPGNQQLKWQNGTDGYSTLFDLLAENSPYTNKVLPIKSKVQLNKKVTSIDKKDNKVELECEDGSKYVADHAIVAIGLGVLKAHSKELFKQLLPSKKTTAIETVGFGCEGKVFMLFPYRWWPEDTNVFVPLFSQQEMKDYQQTSKHGSWTSLTGGFYPVVQSRRMMRARFSGDSCRTMESMADREVTEGLMELLNRMVGGTYYIPQPEAILKSSWSTNPHTLGGYSYNTVKSDRHNVTREHLAEPITSGDKPVILFAGEATNHRHFGKVHGALETGRREAQRLLNYFERHRA